MIIKKVEFKTETNEAIFCDITYIEQGYFVSRNELKREVYLEKKYNSSSYSSKFSDNGEIVFHSGMDVLVKRSLKDKIIQL